MDTNDMRYVNCMHARTHRQNSQLNTLVWGSLTLDNYAGFYTGGNLGNPSPPNLGNNIN